MVVVAVVIAALLAPSVILFVAELFVVDVPMLPVVVDAVSDAVDDDEAAFGDIDDGW